MGSSSVALLPAGLLLVLLVLDGRGEAHESGNEGYYEGYAYTGIHEEMLKDSSRTEAYRRAILENASRFRGAVVVDIGCGTGILSLISAQAGARKVYCIEASSLANTARDIVKANNLTNRITVLNQLAEDVLLPEGGCDIIVSEWMGYFLLYENMLSPVLDFKDKWLNPGGILFPTRVTLLAALYSDEEFWRQRVTFWDDVHGFDFSPVKEILMQEQFIWPERQHLEASKIATSTQTVIDVDVDTVTAATMKSFRSPISLRGLRDCNVHGVAFWFEAYFEADSTVVLDTSPASGYSHWSQVIWYFPNAVPLSAGDSVEGYFAMDAVDGGSFDVEFYLTRPERIYKQAKNQNPDTIYQNIHERLVWERKFAEKQASSAAPDWSDESSFQSGLRHFLETYEILNKLYVTSSWDQMRKHLAFALAVFLIGILFGRCTLQFQTQKVQAVNAAEMKKRQ